MTIEKDAEHLKVLLLELRGICITEGGRNFVQGINGVGWLLEDDAFSLKDRMSRAAASYGYMVSAKNGLSDFYIEGEGERVAEMNARMGQIRSSIAEILSIYR